MPPRKRQAPLLEQIGLVAELSADKDPTIRILVSKKAPSQRETVEALRIQIFNYDGAPGRFRGGMNSVSIESLFYSASCCSPFRGALEYLVAITYGRQPLLP